MSQKMRDTVDHLGIQMVKTARDMLTNNAEPTPEELMMFVGNGMQLLCIAVNTLDRIADAIEAQKPKSPIHNPYDGLAS